MKNIKYFKFKNTYAFECFLCDYGYWVEDIKGFSFGGKEQYHGNVLKVYYIHFSDGEKERFNVVYFKDFNQYNEARLGFKINKLLMGYDDANVKAYKVGFGKDEVVYC